MENLLIEFKEIKDKGKAKEVESDNNDSYDNEF